MIDPLFPLPLPENHDGDVSTVAGHVALARSIVQRIQAEPERVRENRLRLEDVAAHLDEALRIGGDASMALGALRERLFCVRSSTAFPPCAAGFVPGLDSSGPGLFLCEED